MTNKIITDLCCQFLKNYEELNKISTLEKMHTIINDNFTSLRANGLGWNPDEYKEIHQIVEIQRTNYLKKTIINNFDNLFTYCNNFKKFINLETKFNAMRRSHTNV